MRFGGAVRCSRQAVLLVDHGRRGSGGSARAGSARACRRRAARPTPAFRARQQYGPHAELGHNDRREEVLLGGVSVAPSGAPTALLDAQQHRGDDLVGDASPCSRCIGAPAGQVGRSPRSRALVSVRRLAARPGARDSSPGRRAAGLASRRASGHRELERSSRRARRRRALGLAVVPGKCSVGASRQAGAQLAGAGRHIPASRSAARVGAGATATPARSRRRRARSRPCSVADVVLGPKP